MSDSHLDNAASHPEAYVSGSPFTTTRRVAFHETDMAGIVHFSNYYVYMEQAEHDFFRSLGLPMMIKNDDGSIVSWPRVKSSCTYEAPALYDDVIEIRTWVSRRGGKSLTFEHEFYKGNERIAHGTVKTVCCLFRPGRPFESIDIPPQYDALQALPAEPEA